MQYIPYIPVFDLRGFSRDLRLAREGKGHTREKAVEAMVEYVSLSTLARIEGARQEPSLRTLFVLCVYAGLEMDDYILVSRAI